MSIWAATRWATAEIRVLGAGRDAASARASFRHARCAQQSQNYLVRDSINLLIASFDSDNKKKARHKNVARRHCLCGAGRCARRFRTKRSEMSEFSSRLSASRFRSETDQLLEDGQRNASRLRISRPVSKQIYERARERSSCSPHRGRTGTFLSAISPSRLLCVSSCSGGL